MTEAAPDKVIQITDGDRQAAQAVGLEVESLLGRIVEQATGLESNYARLGSLLLTVRNERYWIILGHETFGSYLKSLRERLGTGRTQLYQMIAIADTLVPLLGEEGLSDIGKSKAIELRRIVSTTGRRPSEEIIEQAKDKNVTVDTIREMAFKEMHGEPPPNGSYLHLGGFFVTPDERAEIKQAIECAKHTDPLIPNDQPESIQMKEVMLRFCREFYATYQPEVAGG